MILLIESFSSPALDITISDIYRTYYYFSDNFTFTSKGNELIPPRIPNPHIIQLTTWTVSLIPDLYTYYFS